MNHHRKLIDRALEHIRESQSPDGSFVSLSGFLRDDFSRAIPRRTTFFTSNILACLNDITTETTGIKDAAAKFLLTQRSEFWSFNYWARDTGADDEFPYPPYPDDLDDTFGALIALTRHNAAIMDGHVFSAIAKMLVSCEVREGGPYRTWLTGAGAAAEWPDADLVVNSTVGCFLSLLNVRLPRLTDFINSAVRERHLASPYYPGIFPVIYFLSRFYRSMGIRDHGVERAALADILTGRISHNDHGNPNTLERAMGISALINLGFPENVRDGAVAALAEQLEREGFLPYAFCMDPARGGKPCCAGASALTAAFCAEALAAHAAASAPGSPGTAGNEARTPTTHDHIRMLARAACRDAGGNLRPAALACIEKTSDENITGLAYEFHEALGRNGKIIPGEIVESLSLANLYGWMAYDIYDDALDGENDESPSLIPCANFFLRELGTIYATLGAIIPGIKNLFAATMNRIDNAHRWEQLYCRAAVGGTTLRMLPLFGDYQPLADRSIGHAMGPLAELLFAGYAPDDEQYKNVESFFCHYLIARQIHDDAHDWADDLLRGRINSVGTLIISRFNDTDPHGGTPALISAILPELRAIFWNDIINEVADLILSHVRNARRARQLSPLLNGSDLMESGLQKLESGARRALKERDEALIFLKDYRAAWPSGAPGQKPLRYR